MTSDAQQDLLERLKNGDQRAFAIFVSQHQQRVFRIVYRMLGNEHEAEDVAQEVFVSVFKSISNFRGDSKIETWLFRIATNHCYNRIKYLQRRAHDKKMAFEEHADSRGYGSRKSERPDALAEGYELERQLQLSLLELSEEHRTLLILRDIESLAYDEIAQITGLEIGTVKSRLHRARMKLRTILKSKTEGGPT